MLQELGLIGTQGRSPSLERQVWKEPNRLIHFCFAQRDATDCTSLFWCWSEW